MRSVLLLAVGAVLLVACGPDGALDLAEGDCIDADLSASSLETVEVVDCDDAHDGEVHAVVTLDDEDFPGGDALREIARDECIADFEEHVGIDYAESELTSRALLPTEGRWEDGDRDVVCIVHEPGERLSGSLEGAAR